MPFRRGVSIIEILIGLALFAIVGMLVYYLFNSQIGIFISQLLGIDVASQNKIAITELTNQTREAESIVTTCPDPAPYLDCEGASTSGQIVIYEVWGLDSSKEPTSAYFDYIVYRQDPADSSKLLRKTFPATLSTRPSGSKVIATNLTTSGLQFTYNNGDVTQATQVTFTVTTQKTESGKSKSKSQAATVLIRNKDGATGGASPPPGEAWTPLDFDAASVPHPALPTSTYCIGNIPYNASYYWNHTTSSTYRFLLVHIAAYSSTGNILNGLGPPTVTYANQNLTFLAQEIAYDNGILGNVMTYVFYLTNPALGTNSVKVTWPDNLEFNNNSLSFTRCAATSWKGVNSSTPFGTVVKNNDSSFWADPDNPDPPPSLAVTSSTGQLVVDTLNVVVSIDNSTPGSGQTQRHQSLPNVTFPHLAVSSKPASAGSTNMSWAPYPPDYWLWGYIAFPLLPQPGP